MKIWKFVGVSSRQALRQVKEALGPDALILSNRPVEGGVEMSAMAGGDLASLSSDSAATMTPPHGSARGASDPATPAVDAPTDATAPVIQAPQAGPKARAVRKPRRPKAAPRDATVATAGRATRGDAEARWAQELTQTVIREIQSMRGTLENQLAVLAFGDARSAPARGPLLSRMLAAGFGASFARELLLDLPAGSSEKVSMQWLNAQLESRLVTTRTEDEIVKKGGVYALVGPTGVGKTTTTAKIAARCVVRHGADKVALLTTDSYRIGAHEQLRIFGRILGVTVHTVRDPADLQATLAELRSRHIVLIDTMGMSQRDQMVAEQAAMLSGTGSEIKQLLLLNATCNADTLHDVVHAYGRGGVADCIISKADEAASLGAALEVAMRERLTVHYVANGQRVPEDLLAARTDELLKSALEPGPNSGRMNERDAYAHVAASAMTATRAVAAGTA